MKKITFVVLVLSLKIISISCEDVKLKLSPNDNESNSRFVATKDWQEIKPGQTVPSGLHYRINLQTGLKEAKLLAPDEAKTTSLQEIQSEKDEINKNHEIKESEIKNENEDKTNNDNKAVDEDSEVETARKRLEEALKNIPSEKFDDVSEEKWKEISKKFKSYEEIKADLKEINLSPKTDAEVIIDLMNEFLNETSSESIKIEVINDLEYLMHSIDNSLLFISQKGIEKILIPHLVNQTNVNVRISLLKMFGAMMQNNLQAKKYVSEKTNLVNHLINLLSKYSNAEELSACLYSCGSLMRNNKLISNDNAKKTISILVEILARDSVSLSIKTKSLLLLDDLINESEISENEIQKFIESLKFCGNLAKFFEENKNLFIADSDAMEKTAASMLNLQQCRNSWSELPMFRHTLLVVMNNYKSRFSEESDEDVKFIYSLVIEHLENLNKNLYGDLKIRDDDLSHRYSDKDEL